MRLRKKKKTQGGWCRNATFCERRLKTGRWDVQKQRRRRKGRQIQEDSVRTSQRTETSNGTWGAQTEQENARSQRHALLQSLGHSPGFLSLAIRSLPADSCERNWQSMTDPLLLADTQPGPTTASCSMESSDESRVLQQQPSWGRTRTHIHCPGLPSCLSYLFLRGRKPRKWHSKSSFVFFKKMWLAL